MQSKEKFRNLISCTISCAATVALAIATVFALMVVLTPSALAQTFKVLYNFTGRGDGGYPYAGLTMDRAGNLYGTTPAGGKVGGICSLYYGAGCGTVFKLTNKNSQWVFSTLYIFQGGLDGVSPNARVIFGPDGALYGTTTNGGEIGCPQRGCGTVFQLKPPARACNTALCPWTETVLHRFNYSGDGYWPGNGSLLIAPSGVIYGTVTSGGAYGAGAVFSLTPSQGGWTYSVIYSFTGGADGAGPSAGVIFDKAGNLYGTTPYGGSDGYGTIYELMPAGSGWHEKVLYSFTNSRQDWYGIYPVGGLIFDGSGNLYGTSGWSYMDFTGGIVFELTPSNGSWTIANAVDVSGAPHGFAYPPVDSLAMDAADNLYGTVPITNAYSSPWGEIFKVSPDWTVTDLYSSWGQEGAYAYGGPILDANGNLYGTNAGAGQYNAGIVWEITP
jgi:uncharacterized repeat protein (TIGR03803 family)